MTARAQALAPSDGDVILRRLPRAVWRSLPALLGGSVVVVAVVVFSQFLAEPWWPLLPVTISAICAPFISGAISTTQGELFDLGERQGRFWTRFRAAEALVLPVGGLASLAVCASFAARASGNGLFAVIAVGGTVAAFAAATVLIVAFPLLCARPGSSVRAVVLVSFYAVSRRPIPAFATACFITAVVWSTANWIPSLLIVSPALAIAVSVAAAWPTLARAGVSVPALLPTVHRPIRHV